MYNAFISYSHAADGKLAPALQVALEKFAKPWYKVRNLNIFRDETSLTASPHLWVNIQAALDQSEYLIYLASPVSASSKWINKEVGYWLEHKSVDTILIGITDGEIWWDDSTKTFANADTNSLPDNLENALTEEPFYVDLRNAKSQIDLSLNNPIFKKDILKIAAQLHGVQPKDLASEEVMAHRRMMRTRNAAIAILAILLFATGIAAWLANKNANEALKQTRLANKNAKEAVAQRNEAIKQTGLARHNAAIARRQTTIAEEQTQIARDSALEARKQRANAFEQQQIAVKEKDIAQRNYLMSEIQRLLEKDPTMALRLTAEVMRSRHDTSFRSTAYRIYRQHSFYKILASDDEIVGCVAVAPNGKFFLQGSMNNTAALYDLHGKLVRKFKAHTKEVSSVAFSPDGKSILTGSQDHSAILWGIGGEIIQQYRTLGAVDAVAFSPDGKLLCTGSKDHIIALWDTEGHLVQRITGHSDEILSVAFAPDGKTIVSGSMDSTIRIFDLNGKQLQELNGRRCAIYAVAFSPDGKYILSGGSDNVARLWDTDGTLRKEFNGHARTVKSVAFSPDGTTVLTGSSDYTARLWQKDGTLINEYKGHTDFVNAVAFLPDESSIITCSGDHTVRSWQIGRQLIRRLEKIGTDGGITSLAVAEHGKSFISASMGKTARLRDLYGKPLMQFNTPAHFIRSAALSADGKSALTVSDDGVSRFWDMKGSVIREFNSELTIFTPDTKLVLAESKDSVLCLFDSNNKCVLEYGSRSTNYASFSLDGKLVAAGSTDGSISIWQKDGTLRRKFKAHDDAISKLAFAPGGNLILSSSLDGLVKVWALDGQLLRTFKLPAEHLSNAVFSLDGNLIFACSLSKVLVWETDGTVNRQLDTWAPTAIIFTPDGKQILIGSADGSVTVWGRITSLNNFLGSDKIEPLSPQLKNQFGL